jgi:hypothetical protein
MTMQTTTEHLTPEAAQALMEDLPEKIKLGLMTCASQLGYLVEVVIEMAISGYLDEDSISFVGCNPVGIDFGRPDIREIA